VEVASRRASLSTKIAGCRGGGSTRAPAVGFPVALTIYLAELKQREQWEMITPSPTRRIRRFIAAIECRCTLLRQRGSARSNTTPW
jgi:hypothetical protein